MPQDSRLSPLLSNIVLDEVDWELDGRGPGSSATPTRETCTCAASGPDSG